MSVDLAYEHESKLCKYRPPGEIHDDKIVPSTPKEFWIAAQVVRFDVPVDHRFVFYLDELILCHLNAIDQIRK